MPGQVDFFLLTYMVAAAFPISLAFNIDLKNPDVYAGEQKDFFGYKVLQFKSDTNKGFIVSAPLQHNGTGGICKPDLSQCFNPAEFSLTNGTVPVKHFGLSIAEDPSSSIFTVCSPSIAHECYGNTYLNSVCYKMTDQLQQVSSFSPLFQNCTEKVVDLVFLFDGSASMTQEEFSKNKDFIVDIMKSLTSTSIKFAAVQFSSNYRKVFDFNDYVAGTALDMLKKERHLRGLTNTHKALKYVLESFFGNPASGASTDATQVVVLITDGDPSDDDRHGIIQRYDDKNIIRFVIGVKDAKLDKFRAIASEPKDKNAFKIENYDGLTGVLENFQKKVFKLEGSKVALAGDLTEEMSQSGFSAVFHQDRLILGSVGSKGWTGSIQELHGKTTTHIEDSQMEMDSYMGYSVSVGGKNNVPLFFTGAPRFQHKGQVILFKHDGRKWMAAQRIDGEKFGSYFGAELCSVDVNSDGDTDFLLVGAPQFYKPSEKKEGQIYVYTLTNEQLIKEQDVTAPSMGRFGTTISSLADLNGDGLRDVAVGAPMEDENRGVMYIYLGDRRRGMRSTFSQRIMGQKINPGLRFFGQAIDGDIDLGKDGLPDIVVGSQGMAVVLSSRPVFNIIARLSFQPKEISTDKFDCLTNKDEILSMMTLQACFEKRETTKSKAAGINSRLNISYTLDVDPARQTSRGFFSPLDKKARNRTYTYELRDENTCFNYTIYMTKCVIDTLSPITVKLHFSQDSSENTSAILNADSKRQATVEIPFEKQCRGNDTCIAELEVDLNFMSLTLLVRDNSYFNVTIDLSNQGDDSYNTSLTMYYPPGLSFSMMTLAKWTRPTLHTCHDLDAIDKTICSVSLPVYRSQSAATFNSTFHIRTDYEWNDTISVTVEGNSDNINSTGTNSVTKTIPVQFEVKMAVTVKEDSVTYLNFTTDDEPKRLVTLYKIDNLGFKAFPVNVSLFCPTKLEHNFEMTNYRVLVKQNKTECAIVGDMNNEYCSSDKQCKIIKCNSFILESESAMEFELSGDVQFRDLKQHAANTEFLKRYAGDGAEVRFKSVFSVDFDKQRYVLNPLKQLEKPDQTAPWKDPTVKETEVRIEFIIPPNQLQIITTGAGLGLLLLIVITIIMFKCGCFKRKTLEDYQANDADSSSETFPTDQAVSKSECEAKSDQTLEEKKLLDNVEGNGSPPLADTETKTDMDTEEACPSYEECMP